MLNKEKYKDEIIEISIKGKVIAIVGGKPVDCDMFDCSECQFSGFDDCGVSLSEWANSEYVEREVDWSKVPVDTPIIVGVWCEGEHKRHFAKYENGIVFAYNNGATSWSTEDGDITPWGFAELAEPNKVYMKEVE